MGEVHQRATQIVKSLDYMPYMRQGEGAGVVWSREEEAKGAWPRHLHTAPPSGQHLLESAHQVPLALPTSKKPISARQSRVVGRVTTMTQRNSLASNFINWRIPQTDKLNELTSLTNEQRRFGNGAIFRASRSQTCMYILEKQRKREARKGKEKRGGKRKKKYHHPWIPR
ncbi:hypothetical protein QYF61_013187 [Mycteria americana]|uniref:Uncharacterized protein n=1 Tax=Mycteria americana TaxID=33587 RepID=A0AAN7PF27_MYCAM|nr:hypothetical protein QYF61_013187 [Mycteria americana]